MANLKKNLAYNFLLSFSQLLLPVISIPYLAPHLGPEGIGKVSFIDSLTYYFIAVAEFGIVVYGIREVARVKHDRQKLQQLVSELLILHFITSCFSLVLYSIAVAVLWNKIGDIRLVLFSISFLIVNSFACEWYFWGMERFRYITIRSLITRVLGLISIFILIKGHQDYYIYYAIIVISAIANIVWNSINLFQEVPLTTKGINWRKHIKYVWVTYLISLFYSVTIMLDSVLLRLVSTVAAVGIYAFSIKIVRIGSAVFTDMFLVLYPRTVALLKENKTHAAQQTILKSIQITTLLAIPAGAGIFLLAEPFVQVFLGKSFMPVAENLKILAAFPFIKAYSLFLSKQVLISYDKERLYLNSLIAGSILFVGLTLVLSWYFNDSGACYAIMITELLILGINYYYVKQVAPALKIFDWTALLQAVLGSVLFIPVIELMKRAVTSPVIAFLVPVIICILVYFFFLVFIIRNKLLHSLYQTGWQAINKRWQTR